MQPKKKRMKTKLSLPFGMSIHSKDSWGKKGVIVTVIHIDPGSGPIFSYSLRWQLTGKQNYELATIFFTVVSTTWFIDWGRLLFSLSNVRFAMLAVKINHLLLVAGSRKMPNSDRKIKFNGRKIKIIMNEVHTYIQTHFGGIWNNWIMMFSFDDRINIRTLLCIRPSHLKQPCLELRSVMWLYVKQLLDFIISK